MKTGQVHNFIREISEGIPKDLDPRMESSLKRKLMLVEKAMASGIVYTEFDVLDLIIDELVEIQLLQVPLTKKEAA